MPIPTLRRCCKLFMRLESQSVQQLRSSLLERLTQQDGVSETTPLDSKGFRSRPFLKRPDGKYILLDYGFLVDKLWTGPLFHLVSTSNKKKCIRACNPVLATFIELADSGLWGWGGKALPDRCRCV